MVVHTVTVRGRRVVRVDPPGIPAGCAGSDALALDLDAEWDGMDVRVVLGPEGGAYAAAWEGEPLEVPAALTDRPGWLPVAVVGSGPGGERLATPAAGKAMIVVGGGSDV